MYKHYGYGPNFHGDPRTFRPDYELNTEQEIQNWRDDCAAWDRGENPEVPPGGYWTQTDEGHPMHVLAPRYGYGSWEWWDDEPEEFGDDTPVCLACDELMVWTGDEREIELDGITISEPIYECRNPDCNVEEES